MQFFLNARSLATLNIIETSNSSGNFENFNTMNGVRHYQTYNIG